MIIKAKRQRENEDRRFAAGLKGIKLGADGEDDDVQKKIKEVERRAKIRLAGSEQALEKEEFADLGFGYESI